MADKGKNWQIELLNEADFRTFASNPRQWFVDQGQAHGLIMFLGHDDDGVIWGKIENGQLKLSGESFAEVEVELRALTLQQVRLFGAAGELLVWRGDLGKWHGRYLADVPPDDILEETHRLWGEASGPPGTKDGFSLMRDGTQGLLHAPPLKLARGERAALKVRHYLDYDDQGQAYIALSRLVSLEKGGN